MDPSIMKLLEEDEDETMHSGADVEAFTAALNRDIEANASTSQPSDSDSTHLSQGSNYSSNQSLPQWHNSSQEEITNHQIQQDLNGSRHLEQHMSDMAGNRIHNPATQSHRLQNRVTESQYPSLQRSNNQQTIPTQNAANVITRGKQVPFAVLLPVIVPQLDKDRAMQLDTLYVKLKKNEITKDGFVRNMRLIVGDQMLKMAVYKLQGQARNSQTGSSQLPQSSAQLHQKGLSGHGDVSHHIPSSAPQLKTDSRNAMTESNGQGSHDTERESDSHGKQVNQMTSSSLVNTNQEGELSPFPIQGLTKQQQQHFHFSQGSYPMYGNASGNYRPFSGTNVNAPASSLKQQALDSQMRQGPVHQSIGGTQLGTSNQAMNVLAAPKFERQNSFIEQKRNNLTPSSVTYVKQEPLDPGADQQHKSQLSSQQGLSSFPVLQGEHGNVNAGTVKDKSLEMQSSRMGFSTAMSTMLPTPVPRSITAQLNSQTAPAISPGVPGNDAKTPPKKPSIGQKKPLESRGSSPPLPSKKQKVSGALADQSIEQLNDVTAVSGVNLREEEEQLFSGSKEDSRASEASRRVVQEEEERLILQKIPLQIKLAEIMSKCGVKNTSNDVERCLSLSVEERMRGLISSLIRLSKQRVDIEKSRHRTLITSDVRQQIMAINQKAREEWDKKQSEAEKLQKLNEPEGSDGVDGDKEKEDGRVKSLKQTQANKEEDDKMRTTAANVAARAAVGGDDMLSKWQQMAEQARQKREGGNDVPFCSQQGKDVSRKPSSSLVKSSKDNQESDRSGQRNAAAIFGSSRKFARSQVLASQKISRFISVKDVIAVLEREPQMSKTLLMYRLYEKMCPDVVAE